MCLNCISMDSQVSRTTRRYWTISQYGWNLGTNTSRFSSVLTEWLKFARKSNIHSIISQYIVICRKKEEGKIMPSFYNMAEICRNIKGLFQQFPMWLKVRVKDYWSSTSWIFSRMKESETWMTFWNHSNAWPDFSEMVFRRSYDCKTHRNYHAEKIAFACIKRAHMDARGFQRSLSAFVTSSGVHVCGRRWVPMKSQ